MADRLLALHSGYQHKVTRQWQSSNTAITPYNLVYPVFISDNENDYEEIKSLPGQYRVGVNNIKKLVEPLIQKGLTSVIVFGVVTQLTKDHKGTNADSNHSPSIHGIKKLRELFPDLLVVADVCLCTYADHGHCGILDNDGSIIAAPSSQRIAEIALAYARAGCHVVAPSDMMDNDVAAIKDMLNKNGYGNKVGVLSYAAKFASKFYGPFRDAAKSAPAFGDRQSYQLPTGSSGLAVRTAERDIQEGADMVMVKPGLCYLDIIRQIKDKFPEVPLVTYQVSGEYAMLYHASQAGAFNLKDIVLETMVAFRRAGCDIIVTYFTPQLLDWIKT